MSRLLVALLSIVALTACPFRCMTECAHGVETAAVKECGCCHHQSGEKHESPTIPADDEHNCSCLCCSGGILKSDSDLEHCVHNDMVCIDNAAVGTLPCLVAQLAAPAGDVSPGLIFSGRAIRSRIMSLTI